VIVDSTHKSWVYGTLAGAGAMLGVYGLLQWISISRASGGTPFGLACGFAGTAILVFEGLLGVRKKFPTLRVGRTYHWLKAHIWLGLLAFLVIALHSGFSIGGPLTTVLMILFATITLSGIVGVILQQFLPKVMLRELPEEVIFEQMDGALAALRNRADALYKELEGSALQIRGHSILEEAYNLQIRPYLTGNGRRHELFSSDQKSQMLFDHLKKFFSVSAHESVEELGKLVIRRRHLARQRKLHYILHGWLLVHVPLSVALFVLTLAHACVALLMT